MTELLKYKITPIFSGEVKDGKFKMSDSDFERYWKWLLSHSGKYQFIIKKVFKKRSLPQNNWYWGVILPMIADEMGEENHDEVHAILRSKFLSKTKVIKGKNGELEEVKITGRTHKLSTHLFSIYVEKCRKFGAEFYGLNIPDPDPNYDSYPVLINED